MRAWPLVGPTLRREQGAVLRRWYDRKCRETTVRAAAAAAAAAVRRVIPLIEIFISLSARASPQGEDAERHRLRWGAVTFHEIYRHLLGHYTPRGCAGAAARRGPADRAAPRSLLLFRVWTLNRDVTSRVLADARARRRALRTETGAAAGTVTARARCGAAAGRAARA